MLSPECQSVSPVMRQPKPYSIDASSVLVHGVKASLRDASLNSRLSYSAASHLARSSIDE